MKKRILGLDTGTNSLGWAVVDKEENGKYTLVDKGVLIFQEGVKIEKGIESSKAAERTAHRALRRQYFRRRLRKIEVLKVLIKYNLCPYISDEELKLWKEDKIYPKNDAFMLWQRTSDNDGVNPYHSRYLCLNETLDMQKESDRYTLGRALYHLTQRRGFLSNRLDTTDEKETGAVKEGIKALTDEMHKMGCEYLGEYFYKIYKEEGNRVRIRTRYIDRTEHYRKEFTAICNKQKLPQDMVSALLRAMYFQRPLKSQRGSVGKCTFEKDKARCSDSHPLYEEFRKLSFLNNIRIMGPYDMEYRPLNEEELIKIDPLFYRKSKPNFDFEDIAKKIGGRNNYQWKGDKDKKTDFRFNYRMSQGVPGCPTTAQLKEIFGEEWMTGIAETYDMNTKKDGTVKSAEEMLCDVWNVLFSFDSDSMLAEFGRKHLQLSEEQAEKFAKIRLSHDYSSLSLKAIRKILPFLRMGMLYSHAVFMGNVPDIVGAEIWNDEKHREHILDEIQRMAETPEGQERAQQQTLDICIRKFLIEEYGVDDKVLDKLYHPSMIETYPDARPDKNGVVLLGSPRTNAVRNPMAMRSLHQVRKVVNSLIKEGKVGPDTEVHIEYARELNNANMRKAINDWQREQDKKHKGYADDIRKLYKEATGKDIEPIETDILKFQLWEEQGHICLYTGEEIGIADFIGASPKYDIEHTLPRSVGGDSTQMNMTLCSGHYNRFIKKNMIPSQLPEYEHILVRIEGWKKEVDDLTKQIDKISTRAVWDKAAKDRMIQKKNRLKIERDYWRGKYERFTMTEVPEGFALRQGAGIGLISKYAALYLKSYFHDAMHPEHRQVYSVKGALTAEFRKMWGIQDEYEKKSRDSHTHHCIDAIVVACIGKNEFNQMGKFYHDKEEYDNGKGEKPVFEKPWQTFTQDLKQITEELLVVHDTPDNMPKKASCMKDTRQGKKAAKGDCARGSLHMDTYYGAIEKDGEVRYVVRRPLSAFTSEKDLNSIVDDAVRKTIRQAVETKGFKQALAEPIYMNEEKSVLIKKVRCYADSVKKPLNIRHHRDQSTKEYKQQFHVMNDSNYCMAIYEGVVKGKEKRDYEIVNLLEAAEYYKKSADARMYGIVPDKSERDFELKYFLKVGMHVLLYENNPAEIYEINPAELYHRLYTISGISNSSTTTGGVTYRYGMVCLKYHSESRMSKDLIHKKGVYRQGEEYRPVIDINHNQFNALVEGVDFEITPLGEIKLKNR